MIKYFTGCCFLLLCVIVAQQALCQTGQQTMPRLVEKDSRWAFFVENKPYFILGAQVNNSSAWPSMLPKVWPAMDFIHANTVEMPVYWEQLEAVKGKYDYRIIDTLLLQARIHQMHLILLWFATWKNGNGHYEPAWMKMAPERYTHVIDEKGRPVDSPSPFCTEAQEADTKAFAAFMGHLKIADPQHTVLMIQVENEPGTGWDLRDHSPYAEKLFNGPIPEDVAKAMHIQTGRSTPNWTEAFGKDANVCFHNWAVAKYIGKVAAAGKAVYPLPCYVNAAPGTDRGAALRDSTTVHGQASYEDGGPSNNILPIWKVAAPAIDMICPDNYAEDAFNYDRVLKIYQRKDNAVYIPETGGSPRLFFLALARNTMGFSPFGIDFTRIKQIPDRTRPNDDLLRPWARTGTKVFAAPFAPVYELVSPMSREIAEWNYDGKLKATAEKPGKVSDTLFFGTWDAIVSYGVWERYGKPSGNPQPAGGAFVVKLAENEFIVSGFHCRVDFSSEQAGKKRNFVSIEEGNYKNGMFKFLRLLNGDQTDGGMDFSVDPLVLRVKVTSY
jgi:hypothetical protein